MDLSAEETMRGIVSALERAVPGPPNGQALVRDAMEGLLTLREAARQGDVPDPGELHRFRERVAELLKSGHNPGQLAAYRGRVLMNAQRGRFDGYEPASRGRSALQILLVDFADGDLFDDLARADLEEIDEELEDAADEAPPIRDVPSWVPESHWWWRAPKRTDMSEEERRHRLYGGELDE
ncbi:hypothetical protein OG417_50785 [Actinoallomurus sp. NBC_01490]|jgi:hypothetical protein|uniref:hypothetical protein n=1 Tax=Actinoallomurus sp. NBC_01490 TaxID=2903557 RepID=UPI002E34B9EF|nr:hypothetical protein [Actinoallomurus sp. NBC_01490]